MASPAASSPAGPNIDGAARGPSPSTLYLTSRFDDSYARLPFRLASFGHGIAECLHETTVAAYGRPFTVLNLAYIGLASFHRSNRANEQERHPELMRKARVSAAVDSLGTTWLESITFPSLLIGGIHRAMASSPPTTRAGVALASLPWVLPLSSQAADMLMEWAFRPAIAYLARPSAKVFRPSEGSDYIPPPSEDLLNGLNDMSMLLGVTPDYASDPLARAQLEWALDGDASSAFPEEQDLPAELRGRGSGAAAGSGAGTTGGSALAAALAGRGTGPTGAATGGALSAAAAPGPAARLPEGKYLSAVADIRRRAEERVARAEAERARAGLSTTASPGPGKLA